jgi:predicted GIY-YIG superfamily endonuclease
MAHCVYILRSLKDGTFYKGYSENVSIRLAQHNRGESEYTSQRFLANLQSSCLIFFADDCIFHG